MMHKVKGWKRVDPNRIDTYIQYAYEHDRPDGNVAWIDYARSYGGGWFWGIYPPGFNPPCIDEGFAKTKHKAATLALAELGDE